MIKGPYYTEDILVDKMQSGEYGWLDYVNHFSEEWQNEYEEYCKEHALCIGNESAEQFVKYKDELLEQGNGNRERLIQSCYGDKKKLESKTDGHTTRDA